MSCSWCCLGLACIEIARGRTEKRVAYSRVGWFSFSDESEHALLGVHDRSCAQIQVVVLSYKVWLETSCGSSSPKKAQRFALEQQKGDLGCAQRPCSISPSLCLRVSHGRGVHHHHPMPGASTSWSPSLSRIATTFTVLFLWLWARFRKTGQRHETHAFGRNRT